MHDRVGGQQFLALVFVIRDELYALEQDGAVTLLPWLQRYQRPSAVPSLHEWCLGLLNVRGTIQMLVDLGCLLGLGASETGGQSRLIFIEHNSVRLGLAVDREIGIRTLRYADLPGTVTTPFVTTGAQLGDGSVYVLDGGALLRHVSGALRAPASSL